jgi:signal transduction histidine kinase
VVIDTPSRAHDELPPGAVYLRVTDTGIGIPRDKQGVIFDAFVQVYRDLTRTTEGTGLGLTISRDLARKMGGDLRVRSVPGVGSSFTLSLPE